MKNKHNRVWKTLLSILTSAVMLIHTLPIVLAAEDDVFETAPIYNVNEIIVKYKENTSLSERNKARDNADKNARRTRIKSVRGLSTEDHEIVEVRSVKEMEAALTALQQEPDIEYAVPNDKIYSLSLANRENQWAVKNNGQAVNQNIGTAGIDADFENAWGLSTGKDILIGVMDTGIDVNHSEFNNRIDGNGWNFVDNSSDIFNPETDAHGTGVAGIIAASAPGAKILPLKVIDGDHGYISDVLNAIDYAKSLGVQIINISFGTSENNFALKDAINNSDMVFICAAGNAGESNKAYPAAFALPNVISVGSVNNRGEISSFSSGGTEIDLYSPGEDIYTAAINNSYQYVDGTSFACAYVSSIAALIKESVPKINLTELSLAIKQAYKETGDNKIKIADAYLGIKYALPLNYIKDSDGRLSIAMKAANMLITPDVAMILTRYKTAEQLNTEQIQTLSVFFKVSSDRLSRLGQAGYDLIDSAVIGIYINRLKLHEQQVIDLFNSYQDTNIFFAESANLSDIIEIGNLSHDQTNEIITMMILGAKTLDIAKCFIMSQVIDRPLSEFMGTNDDYENGLDQEIIKLSNRYYCDAIYLNDYINANNITAEQLSKLAFEWQKENNFFVTNSMITPFSAYDNQQTAHNKYNSNHGNYWNLGNAAVDQIGGMVSVHHPLLSLQGRNGLDLNLGLRFDPEAAVNHSHIWDINNWDSDGSHHEFKVSNADTNESSYISQSDLGFWMSQDDDNISISAEITSIPYHSGLPNFYNMNYGLGSGWTLDLPIIDGGSGWRTLYLPGGTKYRIIENDDNTFKLDGYMLDDITFRAANNNEFSSNGVSAAFVLVDTEGTRWFFSNAGRYLGVRDVLNNTIQIHYTDDFINRIIDTSGRYIDFNYTNDLLTISLVDNTAVNPKTEFLYSISRDSGNTSTKSVTDAAGNKTQYDIGTYQSAIIFNGRNQSVAQQTVTSDTASYITGITAPTGMYTHYNYNTAELPYGYSSLREYKRLESTHQRESKSDTAKYNEITFSYEELRPDWMYTPNSFFPLSSEEFTSGMTSNGVTTSVTFNSQLLLIKSETKNKVLQDNTYEDILISKTIYDSYNIRRFPETITEHSYYSDNSNYYTFVTTNMKWDNYGNILSNKIESGSTGNNGSVGLSVDKQESYVFGPNSKKIPEEIIQYTQEKQGIRYGTVITNAINPITGKIVRTGTSHFDFSKNEQKKLNYTEFTYSMFGNLTREKTTFSNDGTSLLGYKSTDNTLSSFSSVSSASELKDALNSGTGIYKLTRDIDLAGVDWTDVGKTIPFAGKLDGGGYTVRNLSINNPNSDYVGLVGQLLGEITNLTMSNVNINGSQYVGPIAGYSNGTIENCHVIGFGVIKGTGRVGGLVGVNDHKGKISSSHSAANISSTGFYSGGLLGINRGSVDNVFALGDVSGTAFTGGLIGENISQVSNSYATGSVFGTDRVGGCIGWNNGTTSDSYATGNVVGRLHVGGFAGHNNASISRSYSLGSVTTNDWFGGGFVGTMDNGIISSCYTHSNVGGNKNIGGFIGNSALDSGVIENSYAKGNVSSKDGSHRGFAGLLNGSVVNSYAATNSAVGFSAVGSGNVVGSFFDSSISGSLPSTAQGLATAEMVQKSTYTDWDFDETWEIKESYPILRGTGTKASVVETEYEYESKYSIYPKLQRMKNISDVGGNGLLKSDGTRSFDIVQSFEYDMFGRTTASIDPNGNTTSYNYTYTNTNSESKMTIQTTYPNNTYSSVVHDFKLRNVTNTNIDNTGDRTEYDKFGNVIKSFKKNSGGGFDLVTENTYNQQLLLHTSKTFLNTAKSEYNITAYSYDDFGRTTNTETKNQDDQDIAAPVEITYEQADAPVSGVSGRFNKVTTTLDNNNNLEYKQTNYTDALGRVIQFSINGNTNHNVYESYNNLVKTYGETINSQTYTNDIVNYQYIVNTGNNISNNNAPIDYSEFYDGIGRSMRSKDPNGYEVIYTYDALGRVVMTETPFDTDQNEEIIYTKTMVYYDIMGRVINEKQQNNNIGENVKFATKQYGYDNMGNLIWTRNNNGGIYEMYKYDEYNRLVAMFDAVVSLSGP
ncbi:MAG: S8 family serine peptidase, partial [Oscillospiraceae bacterium]|nr:S8 family serine peptidase [Oscillospiraceae bacterium]